MPRYGEEDRFTHDGTSCPLCQSPHITESDSYGWERLHSQEAGSFRGFYHDFKCEECGQWWRNVYPYAYSVKLEDAGGYQVYLNDDMLGAISGGSEYFESLYDPNWGPAQI